MDLELRRCCKALSGYDLTEYDEEQNDWKLKGRAPDITSERAARPSLRTKPASSRPDGLRNGCTPDRARPMERASFPVLGPRTFFKRLFKQVGKPQNKRNPCPPCCR